MEHSSPISTSARTSPLQAKRGPVVAVWGSLGLFLDAGRETSCDTKIEKNAQGKGTRCEEGIYKNMHHAQVCSVYLWLLVVVGHGRHQPDYSGALRRKFLVLLVTLCWSFSGKILRIEMKSRDKRIFRELSRKKKEKVPRKRSEFQARRHDHTSRFTTMTSKSRPQRCRECEEEYDIVAYATEEHKGMFHEGTLSERTLDLIDVSVALFSCGYHFD